MSGHQLWREEHGHVRALILDVWSPELRKLNLLCLRQLVWGVRLEQPKQTEMLGLGAPLLAGSRTGRVQQPLATTRDIINTASSAELRPTPQPSGRALAGHPVASFYAALLCPASG